VQIEVGDSEEALQEGSERRRESSSTSKLETTVQDF
jgi:hypothetical protein